MADIAAKHCIFLEKGVEDQLHLKRDHKHFAQVQGEMALLGVEWCDFVVYTVAARDNLYVERISFDHKYWEEILEPALCCFYVEHVAPEILSRQLLKAR